MRFKIFDCYFLDINPDTHRLTIVSVKRRIEKVLRPTVKSGMSYYRLYKNGIPDAFSLEELVNKINFNISIAQLSHKSDIYPNEGV